MNRQRWLSVILAMGLTLVLSPPNALAGPNRTSPRQPSGRAFTPQAPRGNAHVFQGQRTQFQPPRGHAFGGQGQRAGWQPPRGNANGWRGQPVQRHHQQWQHQQRDARGWQGPRPQWQHQQGNASGGQGQRAGWQGQQGNANGWHGQQQQGQQPPAGQSHNPGYPYARIGYQGQHGTSGAHQNPHNGSGQEVQLTPQPGSQQPGSALNPSSPRTEGPSGVSRTF
jgi:hypothetical protein